VHRGLPVYCPELPCGCDVGDISEIDILKIPNDTHNMSTEEMLQDAAEMGKPALKMYSQRFTAISGHDAVIQAFRGVNVTAATAAVLLDSRRVAVIHTTLQHTNIFNGVNMTAATTRVKLGNGTVITATTTLERMDNSSAEAILNNLTIEKAPEGRLFPL